jgi:hypothetical protein
MTWVVECHVASNDEHCGQDEEFNAPTNKDDMECKVVRVVEAHIGAKELLDFIIVSATS